MKDYRIVLHAYYPVSIEELIQGTTVKHAMGDYIGGVMRITSCEDLEAAKEVARAIWQENHIKSVKQVRIFAYDWGTPGQVLFEANNFYNLDQNKTANV